MIFFFLSPSTGCHHDIIRGYLSFLILFYLHTLSYCYLTCFLIESNVFQKLVGLALMSKSRTIHANEVCGVSFRDPSAETKCGAHAERRGQPEMHSKTTIQKQK